MQPIPLRTWIALIAVNIVVSALTTLIIMRVAGSSRPTPALQPAPAPAAVQALLPSLPTAIARPTPASPPTQVSKSPASPQNSVRIVAVNGVGQRQREQVVIANEGDLTDIKEWSLSSSRTISYTFKNVALLKDTFVNVYTTSGSDTASNVFWNRDEPAWQVGDTVVLQNGKGVVIDTYVIK